MRCRPSWPSSWSSPCNVTPIPASSQASGTPSIGRGHSWLERPIRKVQAGMLVTAADLDHHPIDTPPPAVPDRARRECPGSPPGHQPLQMSGRGWVPPMVKRVAPRALRGLRRWLLAEGLLAVSAPLEQRASRAVVVSSTR